ncbi:hypothetical protein [Candidatus Sulfurimonas baltica]|uniref:Uncharacterized protein n=1 Tax=Candidatus Sulfurimonas baltica TaxID=2740404 RepID=A0A7S7RMB5_9BACT|nr:hypothetical protein [Candidatus Sulfurimonas baltica]QOY51326.1 hypothetical protein HUE88_09350 [Candidatus Sulfurimonas baltica]
MDIIKITLSIISIFIVAFILYIATTIFTIFDDASSHDTSLYEYSTFKCKDKDFTLTAPAILYHYNFTGSSSSANKTYRFTYHLNDGKEDYMSVVKTYPIGSKFKFINIYESSSFSSGRMIDFLIEDERGLRSLVSNLEISINQCSLDKIDKSQENYYPSGMKTKVKNRNNLFTIEAELYDFSTDRAYLSNIAKQENNTDSKSTLTIKIPNKEYLYFTRNIVEEHITNIKDNNLSIKIEFDSKNVFIPTFFLEGKSFSQYSCQDINISDIYSCYKSFPKWLNRPYKKDLYIKISTLKDLKEQLSLLKNNDYIIIAYLPLVTEDDDNYYLMVDDYLKAIYSYNKIKVINSDKNISKINFLLMGTKGNFNLGRGLNILDNSGKLQKNIFFLDPKLDVKLSAFKL